jgi:hypothetical protein
VGVGELPDVLRQLTEKLTEIISFLMQQQKTQDLDSGFVFVLSSPQTHIAVSWHWAGVLHVCITEWHLYMVRKKKFAHSTQHFAT